MNPQHPQTDHSRAVARYYDQNTRRFVRWGKNQGTQNIHQALWAEGVKSQAEAVNYANQLIGNQLQELEAPQQVMDLGCGVGSALFYLAERSDENIRFSGVTISATQAEIGQRRAAELGLADRCQVLQGDFLDLPEGPPLDLAYAIEAFLHAADPQRFFAQVGSRLRPGGRLVLIDDFRTEKAASSQQATRLLEDFRQGWLAGSLITVAQAAKLAAREGLALRQDRDLTPLMALGRPRDRFIGLMYRFFRNTMKRSTYLQAFSGGYAKQQCLRQGLVAYRMLVWEKKG
jgi:cyclopropane fatty-acyl-phospholipid synthase-like methyltransferase